MESAPCYRRYPLAVKGEINRTGNIYLFPNLKIPRTTAQYWISRKSNHDKENILELESAQKSRANYLELELKKERALRILLEKVRRIFPYDFNERNVKSKSSRAQIICAIKDCHKLHSINFCLAIIGLTKSRYQRWSSEISFCKKAQKPCGKRAPSQLTHREVQLMKSFITSKKFAYMSISSLHLFAQRTSTLFCSIDTWYKYTKFFDWKRPWKVEKKKVRKTGIRANEVNELWHIDVTVVSMRPGLKLYIQAVIDNFSRFVLAWRVTDLISAQSTIETLNLARTNATQISKELGQPKIMMDPGTENNNELVTRFISSRNFLRILARVEVHYSNSMIERLFRGLKSNYLYHQNIRNIEDLKRKANFYFIQHNNVVPLANLDGGTPVEVYKGRWTDLAKQELADEKTLAFLMRRSENLKPDCGFCL